MAADRLRDRLREGGWEVLDAAAGSSLREVPVAPPRRAVTYLTILHGWPADGERWLASLEANPGGADWEALLVLNSDSPDLAAWAGARLSERVRLLHLQPAVGFGAAVNRGVEAAAGEAVILMDPGTEVEGEIAGPILDALAEPGVSVVGPFGVRAQGTVKEFASDPGPEVDAIEGYCQGFARADFLEAGGYDEKFRFYRISDIEFSFRLRSRGGVARVLQLPVLRHAHRLWEAASEEDRTRLSRRNLYRFLDRWGQRPDLLVG